MAKYLINTKVDFVAPFFLSGDARISPTDGASKKTFKPAQIVEAFEVVDSGLNKHIVTSDSFDITGANPKIVGNTVQGAGTTTATATEKPTYIFTKPFTKTVTVGGVVGIRTFSYKVGDKIQGTEYPEGKSLSVMPSPNIYLSIPYEYIQKETVSSPDVSDTTKIATASPSVFTPKNIVIGVAAFIGLLGLLKLTKII